MENSVNDQGKMCDRSIYPALVRFFDAYLARRDIPETLSLVTEDIYSLGTGESEVALNRKQFEMLLRQEMKAIPEPIRYRIEDYSQKQTGDHTWECFCRMETTVGLGQGKHVCYRTRLTAVFREEEGKILASALHMSEASRYQETEGFFPLRFASERAKGWSGSAQQELLEILCQIMPGGIVGGYLEEGFPLYVINDAMLHMTGYTYEEFVEATGGLVINSIYEEDAERVSDLVFRKMEEGKGYTIEYRIKRKDGSYMWVHDVGHRITAENGRNAIISVLVDISDEVNERKTLREELEKDFLTEVYNRKGGEELIKNRMEQGVPYTFLMMDLDNFKMVNDLYGHTKGDALLHYTGNLLKNSFRESDIVIRIGGDEFAVLAQPCRGREAIQEKAEQIIREYVREAESKYPLSCTSISIGGLYSTERRSFGQLYRLADKILYEVKQEKKGRCVIREV